MYVSITGNKGNQDVYIKQSYRKDNGKTSSRIYKKLGKYNTLLEQFSGNEKELMDWAKKEAEKKLLATINKRKKSPFLCLLLLAFHLTKNAYLISDIYFYRRYAAS
ncbi:MAG: hypothetical protein ACLTKE_02760 [Coprococcus sp.]